MPPLALPCRDGASRSGIFCAASFLCEQIQSEGLVDVSQAVRMLKRQRRQLIKDVVGAGQTRMGEGNTRTRTGLCLGACPAPTSPPAPGTLWSTWTIDVLKAVTVYTPWMGVSSSHLVVLAPLGSAQPSSYIHQAYICDSSLGAEERGLNLCLACSGGC